MIFYYKGLFFTFCLIRWFQHKKLHMYPIIGYEVTELNTMPYNALEFAYTFSTLETFVLRGEGGGLQEK